MLNDKDAKLAALHEAAEAWVQKNYQDGDKPLSTEMALVNAVLALRPPKVEERKSTPVPHKDLAAQLATIETFGFGVENYAVKDGNYVRKGGR